ncbi:hypothetical protein GGD81_000778 [Rhodobium orientis]|uniref:Fibronectin-binding protein n=1 Tax=Rhodobium orientis TaxID=34017 RepID=A0A327JRG7_9HYPH|nr:hypothetical protein [Rhodobium orientis]MBB4301761.1 hypothetical protein [Rhodobium orientis]MBK5950563.1 hypothetical protein [Rhodobium orientis]RAI28205.1 hypothetical protein CH339_07625 [Rhodobium orientis]
MLKHMTAAAAAFLFLCGAALADPTGSYDVVGENPNTGGEYQGTVSVSRTGQTYRVVWSIAGQNYVGTGLGAVFENDTFRIGGATPNDAALSVGYISGQSFGMAFYIEQDDGSFEGVWTYAGSNKVARETWYPR